MKEAFNDKAKKSENLKEQFNEWGAGRNETEKRKKTGRTVKAGNEPAIAVPVGPGHS